MWTWTLSWVPCRLHQPPTSVLAPKTRHTVCLMMQQPAYFTDLACEQRLPDLKALSITAEGSCSHSGLTDSAAPCVWVSQRAEASPGVSPCLGSNTPPRPHSITRVALAWMGHHRDMELRERKASWWKQRNQSERIQLVCTFNGHLL